MGFVEYPVWDVNRDGKLWTGGRILTFEGFNLAFDVNVVDGGARLVQGVWVAIQFKGLANCPNGILDHVCSNLVALANVALSDPFDEGLNGGNLFFTM